MAILDLDDEVRILHFDLTLSSYLFNSNPQVLSALIEDPNIDVQMSLLPYQQAQVRNQGMCPDVLYPIWSSRQQKHRRRAGC